MPAILWDFIRDVLRHWLAFLAGGAVMTILAVTSDLTGSFRMPFWGWIIIIFVVGLLTSSFRLYYDLRKAIGTGFTPLPNLPLHDAIARILGSAEWDVWGTGDGVSSAAIKDTIDALCRHSASGDLTIWAAKAPLGRFSLKSTLFPLSPEYWADHKIDVTVFLQNGAGETIDLGDNEISRLFDVTLNAAQMKLFVQARKR